MEPDVAGNPPILQRAVDEARRRAVWNLRRWIRAGDNVYPVKVHRSWVGRFSVFELLIPDGLRHLRSVAQDVATAFGLSYDREHGGVVVHDWTLKRHSELSPVRHLIEVDLARLLGMPAEGSPVAARPRGE